MTTPRDLFIVSMDMESDRPVERGDLSLALAGAELIDLLDAQAIHLDGGRIVPTCQLVIPDRLLAEAASSLVREAPYESVADWLWRRGRNLAAAYLADLEADGQITRQQGRRWMLFRTSRLALVDSPARRQATDRWTSDEPVLATLAADVGIHGRRTEDSPSTVDDAVAAVLTALAGALGELSEERQRRIGRREEAAEDNRQRGY
ncbi:GOLPH3/VPS74 family protein [Streptantibioticus ferralitis]|uniref:GPP34 family phosphoprotein n=1 Tax=Streptantibioticus ferralitis TaxID=236510 RepID=A0ABT5ZCG0_9ACTN|nr:GPP34 family phosphoprotein [Streptantibioticus ferralitis]MDF2261537.1 GPP34 family phosphoprotein [Streptantibioticus ferralitis]